jgi:predicted metal-dependent hydrolase
MAHLLNCRHGERFRGLMDGFRPDWRDRRDELNAGLLARKAWPD